MTEREAQIIGYIKENPLITQQELADILGIERSSVAVHISNLTKKGVIKGKGYILESSDYVVVIGGSNMDLLGTPKDRLILGDSNPGTISQSPGGVGRNIAENLSYMGIDVKLLSAVGEDVYGSQLVNHTKLAGVDTHYILKSAEQPTSIYMSILDEDGDMQAAIAHMDISKLINKDYLMKHKALIEKAKCIVVDLNLSEETIGYIMQTFQESKIIVDTVSVTKSIKIKPYLNHVFAIKPNKKEAEAILGMAIKTKADVKEALKAFREKGVRHPMISLSLDGIGYFEEDDFSIVKPKLEDVVNANGAGDAFTAGMTMGFATGMSLSDSVIMALDAACIALQSKETVGDKHHFQKLIKRREQ